MICVLTKTEIQASSRTDPASFDLSQVYFPSSVDLTLEIKRLPSSKISRRPLKLISPSLKYQVTLGAGAPAASQAIVASLPSRAVWFCGGLIMTGEDAAKRFFNIR